MTNIKKKIQNGSILRKAVLHLLLFVHKLVISDHEADTNWISQWILPECFSVARFVLPIWTGRRSPLQQLFGHSVSVSTNAYISANVKTHFNGYCHGNRSCNRKWLSYILLSLGLLRTSCSFSGCSDAAKNGISSKLYGKCVQVASPLLQPWRNVHLVCMQLPLGQFRRKWSPAKWSTIIATEA